MEGLLHHDIVGYDNGTANTTTAASIIMDSEIPQKKLNISFDPCDIFVSDPVDVFVDGIQIYSEAGKKIHHGRRHKHDKHPSTSRNQATLMEMAFMVYLSEKVELCTAAIDNGYIRPPKKEDEEEKIINDDGSSEKEKRNETKVLLDTFMIEEVCCILNESCFMELGHLVTLYNNHYLNGWEWASLIMRAAPTRYRYSLLIISYMSMILATYTKQRIMTKKIQSIGYSSIEENKKIQSMNGAIEESMLDFLSVIIYEMADPHAMNGIHMQVRKDQNHFNRYGNGLHSYMQNDTTEIQQMRFALKELKCYANLIGLKEIDLIKCKSDIMGDVNRYIRSISSCSIFKGNDNADVDASINSFYRQLYIEDIMKIIEPITQSCRAMTIHMESFWSNPKPIPYLPQNVLCWHFAKNRGGISIMDWIKLDYLDYGYAGSVNLEGGYRWLAWQKELWEEAGVYIFIHETETRRRIQNIAYYVLIGLIEAGDIDTIKTIISIVNGRQNENITTRTYPSLYPKKRRIYANPELFPWTSKDEKENDNPEVTDNVIMEIMISFIVTNRDKRSKKCASLLKSAIKNDRAEIALLLNETLKDAINYSAFHIDMINDYMTDSPNTYKLVDDILKEMELHHSKTLTTVFID